MKLIDVSAKLGKDGTPVTVKYPMPETLEEMSETYTKDVVYNHVKSSITVALQSFMRTKIDPEREGGPMTSEQLQREIDGDGTEDNPGWKPGTRQPGKSAAEKVREQFQKMDPELRRQLLAELAKGGDTTASAIAGEDGDDEGEGEDEAEGEVEEAAPSTQQRGRRR